MDISTLTPNKQVKLQYWLEAIRQAMAVFRVEHNKVYTVMSNHHLRNRKLTLKAKGLLSQMLSLPEAWDYTLAELSQINRESIDAIHVAVRERISITRYRNYTGWNCPQKWSARLPTGYCRK